MLSIIFKKIGYIFYHFGEFTPFKQVGLLLYKLSLWIIVLVIKKDKRVKSIYSVTDLNSSEFVVGRSDIDILVVVSSMDVASELDFNIYFNQLEKKLLKYFPFLGGVSDEHLYAFEDNFKLLQKTRRRYIERRGKHIKNWHLLYGVDSRIDFGDDETELDGYFMRFCYEQVLTAIYLGALKDDYDIRMLYKYSFHIMRMFFVFVHKREVKNNSEYKNFLSKYGVSQDFLETFFNLPSNKFITDIDFIILALYSILIILESISDADSVSYQKYLDFEIIRDHDFKIKNILEVDNFVSSLKKEGIESVYMSNFVLVDSYFVYLLINCQDYHLFEKQIKNILNNLYLLKTLDKKIKIKLRSKMITITPDIFPLVMTKKLMNYANFFDYGFFMESIYFAQNSIKLFGDNISTNVPKYRFRDPYYFLNHDMYNLRIDDNDYENYFEKMKVFYILRYRLLHEKNKLYITNVLEGYQKYFPDEQFNIDDKKDRYLFIRSYLKNSALLK